MIPGLEALSLRAHAVYPTEPSAPPVDPPFAALEAEAAVDLITTVELYAYNPPAIIPPPNP